jgi:hypothetical protein
MLSYFMISCELICFYNSFLGLVGKSPGMFVIEWLRSQAHDLLFIFHLFHAHTSGCSTGLDARMPCAASCRLVNPRLGGNYYESGGVSDLRGRRCLGIFAGFYTPGSPQAKPFTERSSIPILV